MGLLKPNELMSLGIHNRLVYDAVKFFCTVFMIVCLGGAIMQGLLWFVCAEQSVIYFD